MAEWNTHVRFPPELKPLVEGFVQQHNANPKHMGKISNNDVFVRALRDFITEKIDAGELK